ncbi:hypothetical protein VTK73DRAFT_976 [Phialemonium thermophilum]|uniref:Uncharacterized protein n=1 Tax=Phialemonium thermophilum TaxID=223376 RepID=A0ABR3XCF4_9PEZI
MMALLRTLVQSALLKTAANITAQLVAGWRGGYPVPIDWQRVAEFAAFGCIQGLLNTWWQYFLEDSFPTYTTQGRPSHDPRQASKKKETSSNGNDKPGIAWSNVFFKLLLDQTLGLLMMNTVFLLCTHVLRSPNTFSVMQVVRKEIWQILLAAWKVWPAVALCNFLWVPVEFRVTVASCVGFGWNMFLTFFSGAR